MLDKKRSLDGMVKDASQRATEFERKVREWTFLTFNLYSVYFLGLNSSGRMVSIKAVSNVAGWQTLECF